MRRKFSWGAKTNRGANRGRTVVNTIQSGRAHSSYSQALSTTEATIARAKIVEIGATTPGSEYVGKEAGTGPGCRKKLIEGNIDAWKLMKRIEINKRENNKAVASQAKGKAKRVTGTRIGAGSAVSALEAAQEMRVCFTWIFTIL